MILAATYLELQQPFHGFLHVSEPDRAVADARLVDPYNFLGTTSGYSAGNPILG
jgi:hypothetical protein